MVFATFVLMNTEDKDTYEFDHERSAMEALLGWQILQSGDHKTALEHFKQALIYMPYNDSAKSGMVEALKARYWFYRIFLNYSLWMAKKSASAQWGILLGFYFGSKLLMYINRNYPDTGFITIPLIILYFVFALTTWIIGPVSNLFLRLNSYGKFALSQEEIKSSNLLGTTLLLSVLSGLAYLVSGKELLIMSCVFFFTISIPLASLFMAPAYTRARRLLILYTITMVAIGVLAVISFLSGGEVMNKFSSAYILAFVIYQWFANAVISL